MKELLLFSALGVFIFISSSQTATGVNWVKMYDTKKGTYYIDTDSPAKIKKNNVEFWGKYVHHNKYEISYSTVYNEIDCKEKKKRVLKITNYYSNGQSRTFKIPFEWEFVNPDTNGDIELKMICLQLGLLIRR
ncbi:MAG: surface-adhesin E family protein [Candidatus Hodarchaeales archaeon]|jgi:hypothetical protein